MEVKKNGVDLHIHTTCSDGTRTVQETMEDASEFGLAHIALTDHNQFALTEPVDFCGMEVIPGAEFSTSYKTENGKLLEIHVVGLFFDGVPKELHRMFEKIPMQRKRYLDAIITRLNHLGMTISYEELAEDFPDSNQIGRRHIAEILVKKNYAENITDAFDRLIGNRSPYWVDSTKYMRYIPLEKCVQKICINNGFPILAHPYHYHCTEKEMEKLIADFKNAVGDFPAGMEVYYAKYGEKQRAQLRGLAKKYVLYPSAASDRHAEKDHFERGKDQLLEAMKNAHKARKNKE